MKSFAQQFASFASLVGIGLFTLVLCGTFGCGRPQEVTPQEAISSAKLSIDPAARGGDIFHLAAPASILVTGAKVESAEGTPANGKVTVEAVATNASYFFPVTGQWAPLSPGQMANAFTIAGNGTQKALVTAGAAHPMQYEISFTPVLEVDGQRYEGVTTVARYCLGD